MNRLIAALCCLMLVASPLAFAQEKAKGEAKRGTPAVETKAEKAKKEPSAKQKARQQKLKDCSKQAGGKKLKGDARKKFMSECLKS